MMQDTRLCLPKHMALISLHPLSKAIVLTALIMSASRHLGSHSNHRIRLQESKASSGLAT